MPSVSKILAVAASVSQAAATYQGFNYGSTFTDGSAKQQSDFEAEFKAAKALPGTNGGFTSARVYTMVQGGSTDNAPIAAIPAAISTKTSLLLGLWASGPEATFASELSALKNAIQQYCPQGFGDLVAGISVGSEDLYRNSPIGIQAGSDVGNNPDALVSYIQQVRAAIKGSCLSGASVGHVDTWTAWVNGSNDAVIDNCDWLGMDAYPYFESTKPNALDQGLSLFNTALGNTKGASMGKPVWITETGWPVSGKTSGAAIPSPKNAQTYYQQVGCPNFGEVNIWWYTLDDAEPATPNPSFGILADLTGQPAYDLSCKDIPKPSTSSGSSSATKTGSGSSSTSTGSGSGSGSGGSGSNSTATTMTTSPTGSSSGSGSGSGSGSSSGSGSGATPSPSTVSSQAGGSQFNSLGAAAVALVLAIAIL